MPKMAMAKAREPVREGLVAASGELPHEPHDEQGHFGGSAPDVAPGPQIVGRGFPAGGGQDLRNPEMQDHLGNPEATGAGKIRPSTGI